MTTVKQFTPVGDYGSANITERSKLSLNGHSGTVTRVRIFAPAYNYWTLAKCFIGICASGGSGLDFTTTPVQVFWGGSPSVTVDGTGVWSDWVDLEMTSTDFLLVSGYYNSGSCPFVYNSSEDVILLCCEKSGDYADDITLSSPTISNWSVGALGYELEGDPLPLRNLLDQLWRETTHILNINETIYYLTSKYLNLFDQNYSLRLISLLIQDYGDVPVFRQFLDQYYGSADLLRRICNQNYGDARKLIQYIDEEWTINAGLLAIMEQNYSISAGQYISLAEQVYNLKDKETIQRLLDQIYILQPSGIVLQKPIVTVTAVNPNA